MHILSEVFTAAAAFVATNLDDIVLLTLFFSLLQNRKQKKYLVFGEYLGIATLVVVSFLGARGLAAILGRYIWVVGFLPVFFGVKELVAIFKQDTEQGESLPLLSGTWVLVYKEWAVTVANGSDNLSVYIPLLARDTVPEFLLFFAVMMVMTTLWWLLAGAIVSVPKIGDGIKRCSRYLLPAAFLLVGFSTILRGLQG